MKAFVGVAILGLSLFAGNIARAGEVCHNPGCSVDEHYSITYQGKGRDRKECKTPEYINLDICQDNTPICLKWDVFAGDVFVKNCCDKIVAVLDFVAEKKGCDYSDKVIVLTGKCMPCYDPCDTTICANPCGETTYAPGCGNTYTFCTPKECCHPPVCSVPLPAGSAMGGIGLALAALVGWARNRRTQLA